MARGCRARRYNLRQQGARHEYYPERPHLMAWFRVDDGTPNSDWVLRIPRNKRVAAVGLWTLAGAWSARNDTDGFVPTYAVSEWQTADKLLRFMVESGVWLEVDGGWQFTKWAPDQTTAKDRLRKAEGNAARQAGWRERHNGVSNALRADVTEPLVTAPVPTRPVPTRPVPTTKTPAVSTRATRLPDDWQPSPELIAWAQAECPQVDARVATEKFRDYWHAKAGKDATKVKWDATWRGWMRREVERAPSLFRPANGKPTLDDKVRATLADAARMRAEEDAAEQLQDPWNTHRQIGTA